MNRCKSWEEMMTPCVLGEISGEQVSGLEEHLESCAACRGKLELTRAILDGAAEIRKDAEVALADVRWGGVETVLYEAARPRPVPVLRYAVQSLMAACLILPVALFLMVGNRPRVEQIQVSEQTVARMEVELARQEVSRYLQKSRLVLTDFMQQCPPERMPLDWQPSPAVRDLLTENRYFADDLDAYRLQNARDLCRKLDMVFSEMTTVSASDPCQDINRLQQLVERENLFLKIRIVEQELNVSEV